MKALLASTGLVVLAEMGDKTQLLAMALACRFYWSTVLWGVFAATLANHLLAVMAGAYVAKFVPLDFLRLATSGSFILFGFWTLHGDTLQGEDQRFQYSPFWTVSVSFFLAEMGDKTQLATLALAAEYQSILAVWLGTTSGMLIADSLAIGVGMVMGKKIPGRLLKWVAALIFIYFGLQGLVPLIPSILLRRIGILCGSILLGFAVYEFKGMKNPGPPFPK
jgi:putative Ca2+/H+ antiporter (TMEM165/GDT1 family)